MEKISIPWNIGDILRSCFMFQEALLKQVPFRTLFELDGWKSVEAFPAGEQKIAAWNKWSQ